MRSLKKVRQLAPILQSIRLPNPDWEQVTIKLLDYAALPSWATALNEEPNWHQYAQTILLHLAKTDCHYRRAIALIDLLDEHPRDLDQLTEESTYSRSTVHQTLLALKQGGYEILEELSGDRSGFQSKAFFVKFQ